MRPMMDSVMEQGIQALSIAIKLIMGFNFNWIKSNSANKGITNNLIKTIVEISFQFTRAKLVMPKFPPISNIAKAIVPCPIMAIGFKTMGDTTPGPKVNTINQAVNMLISGAFRIFLKSIRVVSSLVSSQTPKDHTHISNPIIENMIPALAWAAKVPKGNAATINKGRYPPLWKEATARKVLL